MTRLFTVEPTPTERATLRRANQRDQGALFAVDAAPAIRCPACSATPGGCMCAATGATALELELDPSCVNCGRGDAPVCWSCGGRTSYGNDTADNELARRYHVLTIELDEQHPRWIDRDPDDLRAWLAHKVVGALVDENDSDRVPITCSDRERVRRRSEVIAYRALNAVAGPLYADHARWAGGTCGGEPCPCPLCPTPPETAFRPALAADRHDAAVIAERIAESTHPHTYTPRNKRSDTCAHCNRSRETCTASLDAPTGALL